MADNVTALTPPPTLAERVEQATGADRELACTIAKEVGWKPGDGEPGWDTSAPWAWCPDFTASLDAAMTLKADDRWGYDLNSEYGNEKAPGSHTYALTGRHFARIYTPDRGSFEATATTPALALTAACLKARALTPPPKGQNDG